MSPGLRTLLRENSYLLLAGAGIELALLYLVFLGDLRIQVSRFWLGVLPAFLCYLFAVALACRRPASSLRLLLLLALAFRLTMWWSPPTLSEDIYRYVWDGRVQLAGINPYHYAPDAAELAHLRNHLYAGINHKEIPTIYPPLTQLFFRLVCTLHPSLGMMKFCLVLVECSLVLLIAKILDQRRQDPRRVVLYAWNPLPLIEIAGSGHSDILGVFFLLLALYWLQKARKSAAVWALSGAFLAKLLPLVALPAFWRYMAGHWLHPRGRWPLLWFPFLGAAGFLFFADAGPQLFVGLQTYLTKWRFNDALFTLLYEKLRTPGLEWDDAALLQTRQILAGILFLAVLWATLRYTDPYRTLFTIMGAYLLLSPTLHPWYLLWILPFLPLFPQPAWVLFSGLVFLAYEVLIGYSKNSIWVEQDWVKWTQYGPFYLLLALSSLYRRLRIRRNHKLTS